MRGMSGLMRGYELINRPQLKRFALVPLLVGIFVFIVFIWVGAYTFDVLLDALLPTADSWWGDILRFLFWVTFAVSAVLIWFLGFTLVTNLIGAPFNAVLARNVEQQLVRSQARDTQINALGLTGLGAVRNEIRKLFYFFALIVLGFFITVIPLLNLVAPVAWLLIGAWIAAHEYFAYPMDQHGWDFKQARVWLRRRPLLALGFGVGVLCATLVPFLNLLLMPAAVAGATFIWVNDPSESRNQQNAKVLSV